ncbi:MAG: phosphoglycerate kinase [Oscillospiraceae bacterium]|jgi:phosphoglycerate kinase|nr:phosphoglycerate kinase [Oscillospiraceae bacterium]
MKINALNEEKSVSNADVNGKRVLLRCDFNVPFFDDGTISDTRRIDESLETIKFLIRKNARVIVCSHLGRPSGKFVKELTLAPVAAYLSKVLGVQVKLSQDVAGEDSRFLASALEDGQICMIENLRFELGEEQNDREFSQQLASLAEVYVNDAFGTCHRKHASLVGVLEFLPGFYGFLIEKEVMGMSKILDEPKRPFISILGGKKVSDKIEAIEGILQCVDVLMIGGGMTYTFINSLGHNVGDSICEYEKLRLAKDILLYAKEIGVKLMLPLDVRAGREYSPETESKIFSTSEIPSGWQGLDIGPETTKIYAQEIEKAGTVVWNGPLGVSEWKNFSEGTFELARAIARSDANSIIGGGDSAEAVKRLGLSGKMTHISTGGGSSLMFLSKAQMPGISAVMGSIRSI